MNRELEWFEKISKQARDLMMVSPPPVHPLENTVAEEVCFNIRAFRSLIEMVIAQQDRIEILQEEVQNLRSMMRDK